MYRRNIRIFVIYSNLLEKFLWIDVCKHLYSSTFPIHMDSNSSEPNNKSLLCLAPLFRAEKKKGKIQFVVGQLSRARPVKASRFGSPSSHPVRYFYFSQGKKIRKKRKKNPISVRHGRGDGPPRRRRRRRGREAGGRGGAGRPPPRSPPPRRHQHRHLRRLGPLSLVLGNEGGGGIGEGGSSRMLQLNETMAPPCDFLPGKKAGMEVSDPVVACIADLAYKTVGTYKYE